ncbi:MAG: helix-turn-helix transcriptional regulator [Bacteroidetes bacterium]|nr:helix-turn-helix transcriptional regulator [Bacteroidota bacterium]
MEIINNKFSIRLKNKRKENGLSQEKLAQLLGVSTGTVGGYEIGKSFPSIEVLVKISTILETSIDYLIQGHSHEYPENSSEVDKLKEMEMSYQRKEFEGLKSELSLAKSYISQLEKENARLEKELKTKK